MLKIEDGAIVNYTGNGVDKIYVDIPDKKLIEWKRIIQEFERAQEEMKKIFDKVTGG